MGVPDPDLEALADRYLIERELGRGGMGVVYLARDLRHDRPVALKLLLPERGGRAGPERFQREIRFAAQLQHPHILTVLDSGVVGRLGSGTERHWFTMPYVEGESLRDRLWREGRLPIEDALRITVEAARALDHAHRSGVIHRDVKPENLLLTRDGTTLVADFGIAQAVGAEDGLTGTGALVGTPTYMSPEQTDDQPLDARSDLYSLAAVLYEMLSGEPPFPGRTVPAIVARRLAQPTPSVRALREAVPVPVDDAIRRAMAPAPDQRFATVAEFARALQATGSAAWTATGDGSIPEPRRQLPVSRRLVGGTAALLVLLAGGTAVLVWRGPQPGGGGVPVVAVLPFENLGDSADAYFADGVADEIRTKLAQVGGLEVIARGSSVEYRDAGERPDAVARELGADWLLTGTVRWEKAGGHSRVRVTPELVEARGGSTPRTRWASQFDASLTDVFQVQADIAGRVADALGVALGDSTRRELRMRPTASLAAYDEFLKGEAASQIMKADQAGLRRAIGYYERAVELDSGFVQAWSHLSRARSSLYSNGVPSPELGAAARAAAERARSLRPDDPSVYLAWGDYYSSVNPIDNARALAEYEAGLRLAPDEVDLLGAAVSAQTSLGRWDGVATRLARAAQLDPRSTSIARRLATVHGFLRNYPAADSAAERAMALAPTAPGMLSLKVMVMLGRGDLDSARALIRAARMRIDPGILLPFFASYQDLYWVLDDADQQAVLAAPPAAFDDDRAVWALVQTQLRHHRGDRAGAAAYADSAQAALLKQTRAAPDDGQRRVLRGLALAYLGREAEAVREGQRGLALMPISRDGYLGPYVQLQLARIHLLAGEPERALDQLEPLLRLPFYLSPGWLRIDPTFDPLRGHPRFQRLLEGAASEHPGPVEELRAEAAPSRLKNRQTGPA